MQPAQAPAFRLRILIRWAVALAASEAALRASVSSPPLVWAFCPPLWSWGWLLGPRPRPVFLDQDGTATRDRPSVVASSSSRGLPGLLLRPPCLPVSLQS